MIKLSNILKEVKVTNPNEWMKLKELFIEFNKRYHSSEDKDELLSMFRQIKSNEDFKTIYEKIYSDSKVGDELYNWRVSQMKKDIYLDELKTIKLSNILKEVKIANPYKWKLEKQKFIEFFEKYSIGDDDIARNILPALKAINSHKGLNDFSIKHFKKPLSDENIRVGFELDEVKIQLAKTPYTDYITAANIFTKKTNIPTNLLKLKYGKYDVSRYERGYEVSWEEGKSLLNSITKSNLDKIQSFVGDIKWEKVVIGIVPRMDAGFRSKSGFAKSFYIIGRSKKIGEIILARKETTSPMAGQTYLYIDGEKTRLIYSRYKRYSTNEVKIAKPLPNLIKNKKYKITHWDYIYNKEITNNYIFWEDLGDVLNFIILPYGDIYEFTKSPTGDEEYDGYIIKITPI